MRDDSVNSDLWRQGDSRRRQVLGDEHVDRSTASVDSFQQPLQEFVTRYAWGDVWERPGLSDKTRSLLNIAMLTALRQPDELRVHTKGAIRNGCTAEEIREVLIQACVYAGAPAALAATRVVHQTLMELGEIA